MKLETMAAKRGLIVEERGPGHFQIIGGTCLVNYYPNSKRRSAYVAGTTCKARHGVTPQEAVEMAFEPAPEGWGKKPSAPEVSLDSPRLRTPEQWASLVPRMAFAWKSVTSAVTGKPLPKRADTADEQGGQKGGQRQNAGI